MTPEPDARPRSRRTRPAPGSLRPTAVYHTKRELVYGALRDAIQAGRLRAGDRLVISHIGSELGVSDVPVREALFQLEAEGLIDNQPHVGATVAGLDPLSTDDDERLAYLDQELHRALYARCPSAHLLMLVEELWATKARVRTAYPVRTRSEAAQQEHRAIVAAVNRGDAASVEALTRDHLRRAGIARSAAMESQAETPPEH